LYPRDDRATTSAAAGRGGGAPRQSTEMFVKPRGIRVAASITLAVGGCNPAAAPKPPSPPRVVVYCSVDETFARVVLDLYSARTGAELSILYDSEAGKTTGLVNRIIREGRTGRPRADVFWSGELFSTIRLAGEGWLEPYDSPAAADIPARFRDPQRCWTALAVRARVVAFDPQRVEPSHLPSRWEDLAKPEFAGHTAMANPLFGTTRGHVAAMFAAWGDERGRAFLAQLHEGGVRLVDGNSAAVRAVLARQAKFAVTDTDDVWIAKRGGASIELTYPDMGDGGTVLIPCSVAIVRGGPNTAAARSLVDYLVSAEVEQMLAESDSRQIPVREELCRRLAIRRPPESKIDFAAVVEAMDEAESAVREILIR